MRYHKWSDEEIKEMKKLLLAGKTIRDLAKLHNTTFQNISYTMKRFGETVTSIKQILAEKKREKQAQRKILSEVRREIKKRDEFFKKWSDISSYKASRSVYNRSKEVKQDPKSIANRKRQEEYRSRNWLKVLARKIVAYAVKRGYLIHSICPCGCGSIGTEWHHHNGYENALDVVCLCKKEHAERHSGDAWKTDRNMEVSNEVI